MKKCDTIKSGFTLVEMMVSMVILMLAIGGSLATLGLSLRSIDSSNQHMEATHAMRRVYEERYANQNISSTKPAYNTVATVTRYGYPVSYYWTPGIETKTKQLNLSVTYVNSRNQTVTQTSTATLSQTFH